MKTTLILACLFLLAPMLPASVTLLDDGPPGFLHFHRMDEDDPDFAEDMYLRINTISSVMIFTYKKKDKSPYSVRILSQAMRSVGSGENQPIAVDLDFTKKEDAENVMLKITRLVNEAK